MIKKNKAQLKIFSPWKTNVRLPDSALTKGKVRAELLLVMTFELLRDLFW